MSVGFWNFVGAGVFGFLINMPIVSYYEIGTTLTVNHGHAAFVGVFGMLGVALMAYLLREMVSEGAWPPVEKCLKVSFWGTEHRAGDDGPASACCPTACCRCGTWCSTATGMRAASTT